MEKELGFSFLKNIMQNAFAADVVYLKEESEWRPDIPVEIARVLQPNYNTSDLRFQTAEQKRCLYVTRTNLDFYIIHFFVPAGAALDTIAVGPFRSDTASVEEFSKKIAEHPFLSAKHRFFLNYYENLPCVSLQKIINTICYIIDAYRLTEQPMTPVYLDFSEMINNFFEPVERKEMITKQRIEQIDHILNMLREAILKGNSKSAQIQLKKFLMETKALSEPDFLKCKRNLHILQHTIFMLVYYVRSFYRLDIFKLQAMLTDKIERIRTYDEAVKMAYDICADYCMLFQKNTFPEYSKQINEVINYIHLHLQEKLTLSVLSEHFRVAPSKLSASFKQSTGMTITTYIQQVRIRQAMDYLHNSAISVSEIALATGFSDFAYFSKVFKKHTGYSPSEYREMQK